ncbi:unnamed protein product [Phaedon cochleariae]|uniref:Fringe-like glycosyltransferase domain-containing protein n=1 Tax=Phaedon cochleariae TaxID=80249 RepID=A0A9P0DGA3_PHACE|nr:unnamed protein product [Phaedon cochleariae]
MILQILLLVGVSSALAIDIQRIVFIVLSQENNYHSKLAENLRKDIISQSQTLFGETPIVHLSHIDFTHFATWTILPIIPDLSNLHKDNASWIFFLQDYTKINLNTLLNIFENHDPEEETWFGNALYDQESTIIHHFAFHEDPTFFRYPNLASGFAISTPLLNRIAKHWEENTIEVSNFSIDIAHELAMFIWNDGNGPMIKHESALCSKLQPHCSTFPKPSHLCDTLVPLTSIYFAVKTYHKFHQDRVPVVKNTWGKHTPIISFFSDKEDIFIPTINLGIPNTENGHCAKTLAIIRYVAERIEANRDIKWIVIADDDTIFGISALQRTLSCYDPENKVALGERYAYDIREPTGYDYITGGGGMVFSRPLLKDLAAVCRCPASHSPDDMLLGACAARVGVSVTHVPGFHQARPNDYAAGYLETHEAISFHKHWMIDPIKVYEKWFKENDEMLDEKFVHNEL